jgi:hypothetical protein
MRSSATFTMVASSTIMSWLTASTASARRLRVCGGPASRPALVGGAGSAMDMVRFPLYER